MAGRKNPVKVRNRDRWEITYTVLNELYEQKKPVSFQRLIYWSRMPYSIHKLFIEELEKCGLIKVLPFNKRMQIEHPGLFSHMVLNTKKVVMLTKKGEEALSTLKKMREMNPIRHAEI